jgi:uncharacterized protein (TIGR02646 family)
MRRLRRPQCIVPTLADSGIAGRQRLNDRQEYEQTGTAPKSFAAHWTKPDVKGLLHAMQGRVCAYCGVGINGLDVEHFRPKGAIEDDEAHGGYWWLAYEFANYFLGCTVCNRFRKKTTFPLFPDATRCTYATRDTIDREKRMLLDPAKDPVEEWLTINWEDATAKLVPNPILGEADRSRVQDGIDLLGLNVDPEVRTQRSKAYEEAARAAADRRWDDLRRGAMRHRPHSLAARTVLQRVAPERLPSVEDEAGDLADLIWGELRILVSGILDLRARGKTPSPFDERQLKALGWALFVLQSEAGAANQHLADLFEREPAEVKTEVAALFRALPR